MYRSMASGRPDVGLLLSVRIQPVLAPIHRKSDKSAFDPIRYQAEPDCKRLISQHYLRYSINPNDNPHWPEERVRKVVLSGRGDERDREILALV